MRMERAHALIMHTDTPRQHLGALVGYQDYSVFFFVVIVLFMECRQADLAQAKHQLVFLNRTVLHSQTCAKKYASF